MKKDAYYFPHDSNAKDDPKCIMLIEQLHCEGYGIFWILIETLRDQPDWKCPLSIIPALARRFNTSKEKMDVVIRNFGLFQIEDNKFFFSESLSNRMKIIEAKRFRLAEAGRKGGRKTQGLLTDTSDAKATLKPCLSNKRKGKERKGKEKSEDISIPNDLLPDKDIILDWLKYKKERGESYKSSAGLEKFWNKVRGISQGLRKESFEHCMASNWAGLFEKKESKFDKQKEESSTGWLN